MLISILKPTLAGRRQKVSDVLLKNKPYQFIPQQLFGGQFPAQWVELNSEGAISCFCTIK